jgi:sulfate transport system substrate-binding protein
VAALGGIISLLGALRYGASSGTSDPAAAKQVATAQGKAREFVAEIFKRVPVLDSGARGSTNTFLQRGIGDVLLAWENEAFLAVQDLGPNQVELVVPSISILAAPPVAVVEKFAAKHGTTRIAQSYLEHLYSPLGQQLAAKHFYRPAIRDAVSQKQLDQFAQLELFTIEQAFGSWKRAQAEHFDDGGIFDQVFQPGK